MDLQLYNSVSAACSRQITRQYSTSFSLGIQLLDKRMHDPIYSIYGFVRLADEIVDTFHAHEPARLLKAFRAETEEALQRRFSLNPVLNAFQAVVHQYHIDPETIELFLQSMETDLERDRHFRISYDQYILGSAEVVGLMCLSVFTDGNKEKYRALKPYAMKLGSAFQKVNFLRDMRSDFEQLGRIYFPGVQFHHFSDEDKKKIEKEIDHEFTEALKGIQMLPPGARLGVYVAYLYYQSLFSKIKTAPAQMVLKQRFRISNAKKLWLMCAGVLRYRLGMVL